MKKVKKPRIVFGYFLLPNFVSEIKQIKHSTTAHKNTPPPKNGKNEN